MKAMAHWMLKLYPKAWRKRYEDEMLALMAEHTVTWRTLVDLVRGAAKAQLFWDRRGILRVQFVAGAAILSVLCLGAYVGIQQSMRTGANFPQQTIVQQVSSALDNGQSVGDSTSSQPIDVKRSLAPFTIVYNNQGTPISSTGQLNGATPQLPPGVFDYTRDHGVDRLTWQPEADARIAAVIEHFSGNGGGFVLSGRSLRVVENQESLALNITFATWVGLILALGIMLVAIRRHRTRPIL